MLASAPTHHTHKHCQLLLTTGSIPLPPDFLYSRVSGGGRGDGGDGVCRLPGPSGQAEMVGKAEMVVGLVYKFNATFRIDFHNSEMGFNKVYKSLQDIFPQIDARVLRAVAIEHSKDADAAVEAVLVEIIPFFTERSRPTTPLTNSISGGQSSEGAVSTAQPMDSPSLTTGGSADGQNGCNMDGGNQQAFHDADDRQNEPIDDMHHGHHEGESNTAELALSGEILENSIQKKIDVHSHGEDFELVDKDGVNTLRFDISGDPETDETISGHVCPESSINISSDNIPCQTLSNLQDEDIGANQNTSLIQEKVDSGNLDATFETAINKESDQGKSSADGHNSVIEPSSLTVHDLKTSSLENSVQLPDMHGSGLEELDTSFSKSTSSKMETTSNIAGTEDEPNMSASISQSSQIHIMEVLEETIADARNNKSVISLMREVELKEQAAEQAKVEAAMGGADILAKLEVLKQTLQQAKESNDMAVLATELRELQSRVLSLSDERDKSLAVLDEMHETLGVRLAAAENEIKSAEHEQLEKEKAAMKAFADQELIMEKVVQESKVLKQQAEDNAKLREFLVDRGRVVDMLQGEIAVICQDVRLLKENFDENVPFSKSLSSSQTSCILASSTSSSSKNLIPEESAPDGGDSLVVTQTMRDAISGFEDQSSEEKEATRDDSKALVDDGWELFDDREIYA
ncbi:hypothetical protein DH2020_031225 [Rehmannia glutinosa]|uniref:CUE domain-containing protein n=1 Tax=Rehmannia glutinosa TaxID=99300 RepID=A0ABR0VIL4_REHGL